jgi:heme-degrading monooxygenase HmoA
LNRGVFAIIWRYMVSEDHEDEFRRAYGPRGDWINLFALAGGYLGTELIRCEEPGSYVTVDRWEDKTQFDDFMAKAREEYKALDVRLSALTTSEELIGRGSLVG